MIVYCFGMFVISRIASSGMSGCHWIQTLLRPLLGPLKVLYVVVETLHILFLNAKCISSCLLLVSGDLAWILHKKTWKLSSIHYVKLEGLLGQLYSRAVCQNDHCVDQVEWSSVVLSSHIYPKDIVKLDLKIYKRTVDKAAAANWVIPCIRV